MQRMNSLSNQNLTCDNLLTTLLAAIVWLRRWYSALRLLVQQESFALAIGAIRMCQLPRHDFFVDSLYLWTRLELQEGKDAFAVYDRPRLKLARNIERCQG